MVEYIYIYICCVTLLLKMSTRVKSHDLPGQGIGPALSIQHLCNRFKSFIISNNHHTWGHQLLIAHKQNSHTEINQLAVTAKIISQPGIQLRVASAAVLSWQTDFHGLHERLPWLVQHSCLISTQIILVIHQRLKKKFQLHCGTVNQSPSQQMSKCLAKWGIAFCLHAVQQCACKITLRERK
jgi:hypothetical protein